MTTDPRIEIVRAWLGEDNPWENVGRLLARLDALPAPAGDEVERAAEAIYEAKYPGRDWGSLQDEKREDFRFYARAAIRALRPRDDRAVAMARELLSMIRERSASGDAAREKARALVELLEKP